MKKGELSITMIILIVIALVILVIVIFLVSRSGGNYSDATACNSKGGICKEYCPNGASIITGDNGEFIKCPYGQVCCPALS